MGILPLAEIGALTREKRVYEYAQMLAQAVSPATVNSAIQMADADGVMGKVVQALTFDDVVAWGDLPTLDAIVANAGAMDMVIGSELGFNAFVFSTTAMNAIAASSTAIPIFWSSQYNPAPGPYTTFDYDSMTDTGYFGTITSANFISGNDLATAISLSAGTAENSTEDWLKFYSEGKILFIPKKTFRHNLSWDNIHAASAVFGTSVTIDGKTYTCRLMTGANADPFSGASGAHTCNMNSGGGSEWNKLLYRVHTAIPSCSDLSVGMDYGYTTTYHGGPQVGDNWDTFSNTDLDTASSYRYNWCQETPSAASTERCVRGSLGLANFQSSTSSTTPYRSWRPCLELVLS